jgi:hypothetical protein
MVQIRDLIGLCTNFGNFRLQLPASGREGCGNLVDDAERLGMSML